MGKQKAEQGDMGHLVLTRERHQVVTIGDDIQITVEEIRGSKVRLSVKAPRRLRVHRKEVLERIARLAKGGTE